MRDYVLETKDSRAESRSILIYTWLLPTVLHFCCNKPVSLVNSEIYYCVILIYILSLQLYIQMLFEFGILPLWWFADTMRHFCTTCICDSIAPYGSIFPRPQRLQRHFQ